MTHPDSAARERTRWFRCNAHLWVRPDAARFLAPGADLHAAYPALATKYSPNQPRVPAGNPDGGQWTDGSGNGRPRVIIDTTDWDGDPGFDAPGADSDIAFDAPGSMRDDAFDDGRPYDTRLASNEDKPRLGQNFRVAILAEIGRRLIRAFRSENGLFDPIHSKIEKLPTGCATS